MLEQQLINAFMKFTAKAGAGDFVRDLIRHTDENGNPKSWTDQEMSQALEFLQQHTDAFGKEEALMVVKTLLRKFSINPAELLKHDHDATDEKELSGVQGFQ